MAQTNGFTVWLTGMSGTGKTTLAQYIAARLRQVGRRVEVLDEAEVGQELWQGLGDSKEERNLAVRRLGYVANLLTRNQAAVLVASVSPYKGARDDNRRIIGRYLELFVDCPTEKLIERDTTGRYKKALAGEIPNFIGITEPYEPPGSPEVRIQSDIETVEDGALRLFQALLDLGYLTPEDLKTITGKKLRPNQTAKKARRQGKPAKSAQGIKARPAARAARVAKTAKKAGSSKKAR